MTESNPHDSNLPSPARTLYKRRSLTAGIAIAVLAVGAAAGAGGTRLAQRWQPRSVMLLQPTAISTMQDSSPVAAKGNVAELFGNKFILQDASGRALVDLGPRGEGGNAVAKGETVTVQGRFERGVVHAEIVSHADGRSESFEPPRPPRPDRAPPPPGADQGPPPPPRADRGLPEAPPPAPPAQ